MIAPSPFHELHERVSESIGIKELDNGTFAVDVPIAFPDGDQCRIYASRNLAGTWTVTDEGTAVMRAGYENGADVVGKRYADRLRHIVEFYGLSETGGELIAKDKADVGAAVFSIAQAAIEIVNLAKTPKERGERKTSKFERRLSRIVHDAFDGQEERRWYDVQKDPGSLYPVGYRIANPNARQLFIFGVNSASACAHATISCLFHRNLKTEFIGLAIFRDEDQMPRKEVARLKNAVDRSIASVSNKRSVMNFLKTPA
jgi:hypothetical protein